MSLSEDDRAALSAYLDGELDADSTHRIEARLNIESELRSAYDTLRQTWSMLDYLPKATPSVNFTSRTLDRLSRETLTTGADRWITKVFRRVPAATLAWSVGGLLALTLGMSLGGWFDSSASTDADSDEQLVRHLRIADRWHLYEVADEIDFVRRLDHPDLFGDETDSGGAQP